MLASKDPSAPAPPAMADLASYATPHRMLAVRREAAALSVEWSDGRRSRFHVLWLRDNCPCRQCRHPQALERTYMFLDHPAPELASCSIDDDGDLEVHFRQGAGQHCARFARGNRARLAPSLPCGRGAAI